MEKKYIFSFLLILLGLFRPTEGSKIFILAAIATKSHFSFIGEIANVLAEAGHEITLMKSFDVKVHPSINLVDAEIDLSGVFPNTFESRKWGSSMKIVQAVPDLCSESMRVFRKNGLNFKDYDFVLIEMFAHECFLSELEGVNFGYLNPNIMTSFIHAVMGNLYFPSFDVMLGLSYEYPMSFWQRMGNAVAFNIAELFTFRYFYPKVHNKCVEDGNCRNPSKSLREIGSNSSLMICNSIRALEVPPKPYMPLIVLAGGMNCRDPKPLPKDLEDWITGAGDAGVIYFSLGTVVKISNLPEKHLKTLLSVFRKIPQRILWKSDVEEFEDQPKNVKLVKWAPQQDVLGHPNVKMFITHGGLFSITETKYHAKPILGIPVFADQENNMISAVKGEIGESIEWDDLTEELLESKLDKLLHDPKYKEKVQHQSKLMRDQPLTPQEEVKYWTEYVIRHSGARHLRSPAHEMTSIQLYNVDVWLTFISIVLGLLYLIYSLVRFCIRCCSCRRRKSGNGTTSVSSRKKNK